MSNIDQNTNEIKNKISCTKLCRLGKYISSYSYVKYLILLIASISIIFILVQLKQDIYLFGIVYTFVFIIINYFLDYTIKLYHNIKSKNENILVKNTQNILKDIERHLRVFASNIYKFCENQNSRLNEKYIIIKKLTDNKILRIMYFTKKDNDHEWIMQHESSVEKLLQRIKNITNSIIKLYLDPFNIKYQDLSLRVNLSILSTFNPYTQKNYPKAHEQYLGLFVAYSTDPDHNAHADPILFVKKMGNTIIIDSSISNYGDYKVLATGRENYIPDVDDFINILKMKVLPKTSYADEINHLIQRMRPEIYKSIISIPLYRPHSHDILGILHIDSKIPNILGDNPNEIYKHLYGWLSPILSLISMIMLGITDIQADIQEYNIFYTNYGVDILDQIYNDPFEHI